MITKLNLQLQAGQYVQGCLVDTGVYAVTDSAVAIVKALSFGIITGKISGMKTYSIQPMFPEDPQDILVDLSSDLLSMSGFLAGAMRPQVQKSVAELVRTMNCYYSNRLEGQRTSDNTKRDRLCDAGVLLR